MFSTYVSGATRTVAAEPCTGGSDVGPAWRVDSVGTRIVVAQPEAVTAGESLATMKRRATATIGTSSGTRGLFL
jgi:hypothetical protein